MNRRLIILKALVVAGLVVTAIGAGVIWWRWSLGTPKQAFIGLQPRVSFPVLFPAKLPDGYKLDTTHLSANRGVIVYSINNHDGKTLAVTEQEYPANFDSNTLSGNEEFTTNLGKAYIVSFDDRTTASLVAGKTWVLINYPAAMDTEDLKLIIRGYQSLSAK